MHLPTAKAAVLTVQAGIFIFLAYGAIAAWSNPALWADPAFDWFVMLMAPFGFAMVFSVPLFLSVVPNMVAARFANKRSTNETRWRWVVNFSMIFLFVWYLQALLVIDFLSPLFLDIEEAFWNAWWFPIADIALCSFFAVIYGKRRKDREGAARWVDAGLVS